MSKESRKGAANEQAVADYLSDVLGEDIERRVKNGKNDRGDISGLYLGGKRVVMECKCCNRMELAQWVDEAEVERGNDDAEYAVVEHKRKGMGVKNAGEWYVTMKLETFAAIIAGGREFLNGRDDD